MTIVNELIKYTKFILCKTILSAKKLIFLLLNLVFAKHDILKKIIFDRNTLFISNFMRELIIFIDANQEMSIAFHLKTNDQIKRMSQTLKYHFRSFCFDEDHNWVSLLSIAQIAINSFYNENFQTTSFELLYDKKTKESLDRETKSKVVNKFIAKMKNDWAKVKKNKQNGKKNRKSKFEMKK